MADDLDMLSLASSDCTIYSFDNRGSGTGAIANTATGSSGTACLLLGPMHDNDPAEDQSAGWA